MDKPGSKVALVSVLILALWCLPGAAVPGDASGCGYRDSPVYYELQAPPRHLKNQVDLLYKNKIKLLGFPEVDVTDWNWKDAPVQNYSWWIQVEELRFLLPLLKSAKAEDRQLARDWFRSWFDTYTQQSKPPNSARWGEPMSAAYRGMVLVYFLKTEENRENGDVELVEVLRDVIRKHQEFLARPENFNNNSNHGIVEALGLIEVTRVFPDEKYRDLGLDRMLEIVGRSVSEKGVHKEHAPTYHFSFLTLLDRYSDYLSALSCVDKTKVSRLVGYREKMGSSSYYLHDKDGTIPEIGDVDSTNVYRRFRGYGVRHRDVAPSFFFDPEAGYAIYKSGLEYLVFSIQSVQPELPFHYHNDVLSVYYRRRGETILGDPGKYEYTPSELRDYFTSLAVHNTVFPRALSYRRIQLARNVIATESGDTTRFSASVDYRGAFRVKRTVTIDGNGGVLTVRDDFDEATVPVSRRRGRQRGGGAMTAGGRNAAQVTWNFGYDVESVVEGEPSTDEKIVYLVSTRKGRRYRFTVDFAGKQRPGVVKHLYRGQKRPRAGWYSPRLYVMRPCYTLQIGFSKPSGATMITRLIETADDG